MGGKDHWPVVGAIRQLFDKYRALVAQTVHHKLVMDDLMAHIDRGTPFLDCHFNDLDCPVDAGAKSARGGEVQDKGGLGHGGLLGVQSYGFRGVRSIGRGDRGDVIGASSAGRRQLGVKLR